MSDPEPGLYARLESSFQAAPNLRQSKHLPRRSDPCRSPSTAPPSIDRDDSFTSQATDDSDSTVCSQDSTLLESPGALDGTDSGLPPTPPTISQDGKSPPGPEQPPHADSVRNSLISQKSSLSTPVNARSPPTPDPSPPRTNASNATLERPPLNTYPSSRATSYQTAREDPVSSDREESRPSTPTKDRLSTVEEDRGLGLAFEQERDDVTPTALQAPSLPATPTKTKTVPAPDHVDTVGTIADAAEEDKGSPTMDDIPNREWNTEMMRNLTFRKKRRPKSQSPHKTPEPAVTVVESASPSPSPSARARRASSLRKRVQVGHNSPVSPSVENFAQSIGWPSDNRRMSLDKQRDSASKRLSTASVSSTVVSAHVIVTPPQRKQTLRHSGRNMAYRRDVSSLAEPGSDTHSNRNSVVSQADSAPVHRLVHKRTSIADRNSRNSIISDMSASQRMSPSLSLRQRTIDSSAHTLAHQESVRHVLQPAADILSRHSAAARLSGSHHKRVNSAPEAARRLSRVAKPRNFSEISPPGSPRQAKNPFTNPPVLPRAPSPPKSPKPRQMSPTSRKKRQSVVLADTKLPTGVENDPPLLPSEGTDGPAERDALMGASHPAGETPAPSAMLDRVRRLLGDAETNEGATLVAASNPNPATLENLSKFPPLKDGSPIMRQGSRSSRPGSRTSRPSSSRPGSWDPKRFSLPLDRSSVSPDWHRYSGEHGHVSFDRSGSRSASRSASRAEEHAMARHLFSQSTPFSQFSDTVEVTEATAVSIYPHNNNSLLVVQQLSRGNTMLPEQRQLTGATHLSAQDPRLVQAAPTPGSDRKDSNDEQLPPPPPQQPTLTFEPSTPPMQMNFSHSDSADSVLENPREPPEPPKINFIPPTPMEELEKPLAASPPGPPRRSDSHPQRRLSVLQRARRYSDNLITPLLARKGNSRARYNNESEKHTHQNPQIPSVNDEDGTLHPFWRPRGFWDEFSDSEDDSEDDVLPQGGDTSDVEDPEPEPEPEPPRRANTLKKFKGGFRGSGGFLIGNSLGVERHGTNKRRHHVNLPPHVAQSLRSSSNGSSSPKIIIQSPTLPLGRHGGGGISKRHSSRDLRRSASVPDNLSIEYEQSRRNRGSWRQGKRIPGLKKYHVQYIGISGVKEKLKERRTEKRREKIRRSIGHRYYVDPAAPDSPISQ